MQDRSIEVWSLYCAYLNADDDSSSWHEKHHLSEVIARWCLDQVRALSIVFGLSTTQAYGMLKDAVCERESKLDAIERARKAELSSAATQGIERLNSIHMHSLQAAYNRQRE